MNAKKITTGLLKVSLFALVLSGLPGAVFAAYGDVSVVTDTLITVGSVNLTVSGSTAVVEQMVVNADSVVFTMPQNSKITVTSADLRQLSQSGGSNAVRNTTCNGSTSSIELNNTSSVSETVTVTVESTTCSGSAGGGGGGGGGSGSSKKKDTTDTAEPKTSTTSTDKSSAPVSEAKSSVSPLIKDLVAQLRTLIAALEAAGGSVSPATKAMVEALANAEPTVPAATGGFGRDLEVGASGADVTALQELLIGQGYSIPAGATGFFGGQTKTAVMEYQKKNGLPSTGFFGPKTRAHIEANQ